ncbi:hypothetical protein BSL78_23215, partial [Apostichopus japonicus]
MSRHLSSMKLKTIPERLFENTSITMILDIGDNELEEIPAKLFSINPKVHFMTALFLCGNKLKTLPRGLFDNLHYLQNLFLHDNNLKTLPGSILAGTSLTTLLLQDNPIRGMSSAFLDELIDGGAITCLRPSTVMVMNVSNDAARWFQTRGFYCIETQVDNLNECTSCPTGTYSSTSSAVTCQACPRGGFYQDQVGQYSSDITPINCKNCTEGIFVWEGSGKDPLSCKVCPTGTNKNAFAGFRACFCLENYFRRDRFDECELCPQEGVQCKDDYM